MWNEYISNLFTSQIPSCKIPSSLFPRMNARNGTSYWRSEDSRIRCNAGMPPEAGSLRRYGFTLRKQNYPCTKKIHSGPHLWIRNMDFLKSRKPKCGYELTLYCSDFDEIAVVRDLTFSPLERRKARKKSNNIPIYNKISCFHTAYTHEKSPRTYNAFRSRSTLQ